MRKENWTYKKLGEVCDSELGKTLNSSKDKGELRPYLCAVNVLWDKIDLSILKETRFEEDELDRYSVKKGDLLVCEGGDVGRAAIWNDETVIQYQNALHKIRFKGDVIPRFCLFYLRHLKDNGTLDAKYAKGVTIKHLVKSSLLSIPIPIPPIKEQEEICSLLDKLSLVIDKQKAQLKELDYLAQAIFYDMFGDPVENEKGWRTIVWKELFDTILGKMLDVKKQNPNDEHRRYLGNTNVQWCSFELSNLKTMTFSNKEIEKFSLKRGDILICEGGESGRCAVWEKEKSDILFQKAIHRARVKSPDTIEPHYIPFLMKKIRENNGLKNYVSQSTIEHLTGEKLNQLSIIVPPFSLQQSFAEKVEAIERQKELINQSIAEVQTLFDSQMEYYFGE